MPTIAGLASSKRTGQIAFATVRGFYPSFYFGQYAIRSALRVMVPELTKAFGLTTLGVSLLLGLYYYTYSSFAIVARAALDRCSAAMIPYAINFLVFTLGALLAPAYGWLLNDLAGGGKLTETVFRNADSFGVAGIVLAIVMALFLRETGSASHAAAPMIQTAKAPA